MSKQDLKNVFEIKLHQLNVRCRNILGKIKLLDYDSFYKYYIEQKNCLDFKKVQNCGSRTENKLNQFVQEIIKNYELENNENDDSTVPKNFSESEIKYESLELTPKIRLEFQQQFISLSARSRNILASIGADKPDVFLKEVLFPNFLKKILDIKNCGVTSFEEIKNFRVSILHLIDNIEYTHSKGFFNDLKIYLFTENVLKAEERDIFQHYYGFIHATESKSLEEIAENFELTKERIRQISFIALDKIKSIACNIFLKGNYDLLRYFPSDFFHFDKERASKINELEETNFNYSFITYILESVQNAEYNFIPIDKRIKSYTGVFIKKTIQFDFQKCFEYLSQYLDVRRKEDVIIKIDTLLTLFKINPNDNFDFNNKYERNRILEIFGLFKNIIITEKNEIIINENFISFKRNTKKLLYQYLEDILDEYKKPLHFTELNEECKKRNIKVKSPLAIHGMLQHYPKKFGLKGPGIYGLLEWGGYFGKIGDVAERLIKERHGSIEKKELFKILSRELYISKDSINTVLFFYEAEQRFTKLKNNKIGLKQT